MVAIDPEPAAGGGIQVEAGEVHDVAIDIAHRLEERERVEHTFLDGPESVAFVGKLIPRPPWRQQQRSPEPAGQCFEIHLE
jgi:hypothetical protein